MQKYSKSIQKTNAAAPAKVETTVTDEKHQLHSIPIAKNINIPHISNLKQNICYNDNFMFIGFSLKSDFVT